MPIVEVPSSRLALLARIPITFRVDRRLDPETLEDVPVAVPRTKDYDACETPADWAKTWDVSHWGLLIAADGERWVGGAAVAMRTPGLDLLEGRDDLAALWDLRVEPGARGAGLGARLFAAAERWAVAHGARELVVETQDINVPACRFYAKQGCRLAAVNRGAYERFPDEIQLLWRKAIV